MSPASIDAILNSFRVSPVRLSYFTAPRSAFSKLPEKPQATRLLCSSA